MNSIRITYKTQSASIEEIFLHLSNCNENFKPPLDQKVNILDYSKKIQKESVTFEAWSNLKLVGLVASYFNSKGNQFGFITNVSVLKNYERRGIAATLMGMCISYAKDKEFEEIDLEVYKENKAAVELYNKFAFAVSEEKEGWFKMKLRIKKP